MHINKKITFWIVVSIIGLILTITVIKILYYYANKPIYKITAEISGGWIWGKHEVYYTVYKNGKCEKTNEYNKESVEIYDLKEIDGDYTNKYAQNTDEIICWIKDRNLSPDKLFILDGNYLFTVENSLQSLNNTTLYKYSTNSKVEK